MSTFGAPFGLFGDGLSCELSPYYSTSAAFESYSAPPTSPAAAAAPTPTASQIEARIAKLESSLPPHSTPYRPNLPLSPPVARAFSAVLSSACLSARFRWVPSDYYSWPLEERASCLGAHSTKQLCKAMLMENVRHSGASTRSNSKHYLVVLQYVSSISAPKLASAVRSLLPPAERLPPSKFEFRVASEKDSDELTGFLHNSVSPFGLSTPVPVVMSRAIGEDVGFLWLGAGDVDLKVGVSVENFERATGASVLDVAEPRAGA
jgi:hypothetical protein